MSRLVSSVLRFGAILALSGSLGCAGGNWSRFRAERFEAADDGDDGVISASTYDALTKIQSLAQKGQQVDALDRLEDLESQVKAVPKERALVFQAKAYVLMNMGRLNQAPAAIEQALEPGTLPESTAQDLRYNLAQIYASQGEFAKAAPALEHWIAQSDAPEPKAVALLAYIYHEKKEFGLAERYGQQALGLGAPDRAQEKEWRKILLSSQIQQKKHGAARRTLMLMLGQEPTSSQHWRTLYQLDLLLEHPQDALASLEIRENLDGLQEAEVLSQARLSIVQGIPFRGAELLANAISTEKVSDQAPHWSLLGHAYLAAKEERLAIDAFAQCLARQKDPQKKAQLSLRLAGLCMRSGQWDKARVYARQATKSEQAQERANGLLIQGIASYQLRDIPRSLELLAQARTHGSTRASAQQWEDLVRVQAQNLALIDASKDQGRAR